MSEKITPIKLGSSRRETISVSDLEQPAEKRPEPNVPLRVIQKKRDAVISNLEISRNESARLIAAKKAIEAQITACQENERFLSGFLKVYNDLMKRATV